MNSFFTILLRAGICGVLFLSLFGQTVVIPGMAADEVDRFPPYAPFAVPYVAVAILGVACVQVILFAMWMLLAKVERDAIFDQKAFRWVDVTIGAALAATALSLGVTVHLLVADIPSPADGMELLGALGGSVVCAGAGASFAMLVAIMRGLLRKATDLKTEMAEVV